MAVGKAAGRKAAETTPQSREQIAAALESFLADFPNAVVMEDGKVLFDMRAAKYSLSTEYERCTLHLWGEDRNLVRRVTAAELRDKVLRVTTQRFGQARPQTLEFAGDKDRRTPSTREATRERYVKVLTRALDRHFEHWRAEAFRTAMDLEKSFGPAYARGLLVQGQKAWAVIGVNDEETPVTVDGILTFGILWLAACREASAGKRIVQGLKVVVPRGMAALTHSRMAWLAGDRAGWELYEHDLREDLLLALDADDQGNVKTRLLHAPNVEAARERFAASAARIMALVPEAVRSVVAQRLRSGTELAFLLHGLEFARVRIAASNESFNRVEQITVGAGTQETELTEVNAAALREMVARLCERRRQKGRQRDPLFRMQPERWLEENILSDVSRIDTRIDAARVYSQVAAFAAHDRGMLDLLSVTEDGRLAVMELKAEEDPQLCLQGLDYWVRVRWHHLQNPDRESGLGEFQQHGYFSGIRLSKLEPRLFLVAPALRVHPATEVVLRYLSPRIEWTLVALDERWRQQIKVVWRKRSGESSARG